MFTLLAGISQRISIFFFRSLFFFRTVTRPSFSHVVVGCPWLLVVAFLLVGASASCCGGFVLLIAFEVNESSSSCGASSSLLWWFRLVFCRWLLCIILCFGLHWSHDCFFVFFLPHPCHWLCLLLLFHGFFLTHTDWQSICFFLN